MIQKMIAQTTNLETMTIIKDVITQIINIFSFYCLHFTFFSNFLPGNYFIKVKNLSWQWPTLEG